MKNHNAKQTVNRKKRNLLFITSAVFFTALGSSATTLFYMFGKDKVEQNQVSFNAPQAKVDKIKNMLFENLTAADLQLNSLVLRAKNLGTEGNNLTFAFTGGAQYLSFMKDYMGYDGAIPDGSNTQASFGGRCNVQFVKSGSSEANINEEMKVYTNGNGKIYVEWNDTGYQVSGNFINNALLVLPEFISQLDGVNEIANKLTQIDILSLLPMVGTIGGSLCGEDEGVDGAHVYKAVIPGSLLGEGFESDIVLALTCDDLGNLTALELEEIEIPVGTDTPIKISLRTEALQSVSIDAESAGFATPAHMIGVNAEEANTPFGYEKYGVTTTSLEEFYNNNLDSTPNLAYTVAAMMKAKQVKMDMALKFEEKTYDPSAPLADKIGDSIVTRQIEGELGATIENNDFAKASYSFALKQNATFGNSIKVTYQGKTTDEYQAGVYASVNDDIKVYYNTESASDITVPMTELNPETAEAATSLVNANDILSNTVIGDIIDGKWYKYHDILNKIELKEIEGYQNLLITVKASGLNLNIKDYFAFEDTLITLRLRYKQLDEEEGLSSTRITDISIENIPIRKVTNTNGTFIDTASLVLSLSNGSEAYIYDSISEVNEERIVPLINNETRLNEYADLKPAINLVDQIVDITGNKKIGAEFVATYLPEGHNPSDPYTVTGGLKADFSRNFKTDGDNLVGNDYGSYEFDLHSTVNQIDHNIMLHFLPYENASPRVYYTYNSQNDKYQTRLKIETGKVFELYGAITKLLDVQASENNINTEELTDKAFSTVTDNIEKTLNLVDGNIWDILSNKLPTEYIKVNNIKDAETGVVDTNSLKVVVNSAIFGSEYTGDAVTLVLDTNTHEVVNLGVKVVIPDTKDQIGFTFKLKDLGDEEISLPNGLTDAQYRSTNSTINALIDIVSSDFLNSFDFKGVLSNKRTTPSA